MSQSHDDTRTTKLSASTTPNSAAEINHSVVATDAIAGLEHVIHADELAPTLPDSSGELPRLSRFRATLWKQVLLTSLPLLMADMAALLVCFGIGSIAALVLTPLHMPATMVNHFAALAVMNFVLGILFGLYPAAGINPVVELRQQVTTIVLAYASLILLNALVGVVSNFELVSIVFSLMASVLLVPICRYAARYLCCRQSWWGQPVIVVGAGPQGRAIHRFLDSSRPRGMHSIGVIDTSADLYWNSLETSPEQADVPFLGTLDELMSVCKQNNVFRVIAILIDRDPEQTQEILTRCGGVPSLTILSSRVMLPSLWTTSYDCVGLTGIHIQDRLLSPIATGAKRAVDIFGALAGLIVSLPIFAIAALVLTVRSPGPLFYGHHRTGRNGRRFRAWKIRTMVTNAAEVFEDLMERDPEAREEWNRNHKLKKDPRIVGGFVQMLRKTSLDELPQLWNVLVGDMSLVGPRPLPDDELERYGDTLPIFMRLRPGLTGLWQVSGRNNTAYDDKVRLDTYYVRNWSLWLDYYIFLRTIKTVILREGAY